MLVKEVVFQVLNILQNNELSTALKDEVELTETQNEELDILLMCVNMVQNIIATDYIKLKETVSLHNTTGKVMFSNITDKNILDIVKIFDAYGNNLKFKMDYDGVVTKKGKINICFAFIPKTMGLEDELYFKTHMTERVFAYGVLGEYFFVKGNFDDASIWDVRFKQALLNIRRNLREIKIPKREWI